LRGGGVDVNLLSTLIDLPAVIPPYQSRWAAAPPAFLVSFSLYLLDHDIPHALGDSIVYAQDMFCNFSTFFLRFFKPFLIIETHENIFLFFQEKVILATFSRIRSLAEVFERRSRTAC
jgi:hypothetical protein